MSRTVSFVCLLLALPAVAYSQNPPVPTDTTAAVAARSDSSVSIPAVADAIAARDSGNLAGAAAMLRQLLDRDPVNGEATRHLAQLLYWLKDISAALELYEKGVRQHPEDLTMKLDYGRMLVETRNDARATEILVPLTSNPETSARASTLLGTLHYWRGDLVSASRLFRTAVAVDGSLVEARKSLDEIRVITAPWTTVRVGGMHDDQPVDRVEAEVEGGGFLTPALRLTARARTAGFSFDQSGSSRVVSIDGGFTYSTAASRFQTVITGGAVHRSFAQSPTDWIATASARLRVLNFAAIQARAERTPYLATVESLSDSVMVDAITGLVALDHSRGWIGEAACRLEHFSDNNNVRTAYAWLLAPAAREEKIRVHVGYGVSYQDADETRFTLRYDPYFTPENIVTHTAIASVTVSPSRLTNIMVRGGYGVVAHEDVPPQPSSPGAGGVISLTVAAPRTFTRREFTPWDAHVTLNTALSPAVTLSASIDAMRTAFYQATTAGVRVNYRFLPRASR